MEKYLTPKRRRYAYRVSAAVLAYLAVKGLVSGDEADALFLVLAAAFGVADRNVSE